MSATFFQAELSRDTKKNWQVRGESNTRALIWRQRDYHYLTDLLVGETGFEPVTSGFQNQRDTQTTLLPSR